MTCVGTVAKMDAISKKFRKDKSKRGHQSPRHALKASLRQAAAQNRLTIGLNDCIRRLKRNLETVMVCLVLQGFTPFGKIQDEVEFNIQWTLLQAFCAESRINVVHVLISADLMRLVEQLVGKMKIESPNGSHPLDSAKDCSILLDLLAMKIYYGPLLVKMDVSTFNAVVIDVQMRSAKNGTKNQKRQAIAS